MNIKTQLIFSSQSFLLFNWKHRPNELKFNEWIECVLFKCSGGVSEPICRTLHWTQSETHIRSPPVQRCTVIWTSGGFCCSQSAMPPTWNTCMYIITSFNWTDYNQQQHQGNFTSSVVPNDHWMDDDMNPPACGGLLIEHVGCCFPLLEEFPFDYYPCWFRNLSHYIATLSHSSAVIDG